MSFNDSINNLGNLSQTKPKVGPGAIVLAALLVFVLVTVFILVGWNVGAVAAVDGLNTINVFEAASLVLLAMVARLIFN